MRPAEDRPGCPEPPSKRNEKDRALAALEAEVLKGIRSGGSSPMTDDDWREIRAEIHRRHARRKQHE